MLKIRYFRVKLPGSLDDFSKSIRSAQKNGAQGSIKILRSSSHEIVLTYTISRIVNIRNFLADGSETLEAVSTMEVFTLRLFNKKDYVYISLKDPPRGSRMVADLLEFALEGKPYFIEPLEFSADLIKQHISNFDSSKLVSAKVRDFEVYEGAVGRLEISSRAGLLPTIAPFLENKFYRIDSVTYEVTQNFVHGLIYYFRNGTLKVSDPLIELAFTTFEACCE